MTAFTGHNLTDALVDLSRRASLDDLAVATQHAFAGEPPSPAVGELWTDTLGDKSIKIRNAAGDGWDRVARTNRDQVRQRFATGGWVAYGSQVLGWRPRIVTASFVHYVDLDAGDLDVKTVTLWDDGVADNARAEVQSSDSSLASTPAATADDPVDRRIFLRCLFSDSGFRLTVTGARDHFYAPGRFVALGE